MPEIDTELFQQIVIGLLVLLLLVGLLILNALGKIRKAIESRGGAAAEQAPAQAQTFAPGSQAAVQPVQSAPATDVYSQPWGEAAPQQQPQQAATGFDVSPAPAAEPIPEEQPFERDGRWWFKRGDELLVYDEGTGQWTPAPADSPVAEAMRARTSGAATAQFPAMSEGGGFWKCPSCGAVNGSTSATCRMCFTPRPA